MRPYSASLVNEGTIMIGSQVAKVVESKSSEYPVGTLVVGYFGWRNMTVVDPAEVPTLMKGFMQKLPDLGGLSPSLGLEPSECPETRPSSVSWKSANQNPVMLS